MTDSSYFLQLERINESISRVGWAVQFVFPAPGEHGPCWAYTIGLYRQRLPELIIVGPAAPLTYQRILNTVGDRMAAGDLLPSDGLYLEGVIDNFVVRCRMLHRLWQFEDEELDMFGMLLRFTDSHNEPEDELKGITAVQILWPDAEGRFPGRDADFAGGQPLLQGGRPKESLAGE